MSEPWKCEKCDGTHEIDMTAELGCVWVCPCAAALKEGERRGMEKAQAIITDKIIAGVDSADALLELIKLEAAIRAAMEAAPAAGIERRKE